MKNKFSRFIAGILAAAVVFTAGDFTVFAQEEVAVTNTGVVDVMITAGIPMQSASEFTVALSEVSDGAETVTRNVVLDPQDRGENAPSRAHAVFPDLEDGLYELRITGDGYLAYTQQISVEGIGYRLELSTGKTAESSHQGLLVKGDVNADGRLDEQDAACIVDFMQAGAFDGSCDLNGDGKIDLLDLNYFTRFYNGFTAQEAVPEKYIPLETAKISTGEGVSIVEGSLAGLSEGNTGVVLMPKNGEEISETNPVEVSFDFASSVKPVMLNGMVFTSLWGSENAVEEGFVTVTFEENGEKQEQIRIVSPQRMAVDNTLKADAPFAVSDADGEISIDLGRQVAVKKVTLTITATSNKKNLAEITKVEFLNDMESRIPEPVMNIPKNLTAIAKDKEFMVSWDKESNVTGYEIRITSGEITEYIRTTVTSLNVRQFNKDKLKNNTEYTVCVQSVNGEWKSGYSESVTAIPKPGKVPDAPDGVFVKGGYQSIRVGWGKTEDADSYNIYYRKDGEENVQKISGITELSYQIEGLTDDTKYLVYVTAVNALGEGAASLTASDVTFSGFVPANLPAYKLINTSNGEGVLSSHIILAQNPGSDMVDSPLDKDGGSAFGLFDNSYASHLKREDWDYGGAYPGENKGVIAQFDDRYPIGMITFAEPVDVGSYSYASVFYWDENGSRQQVKDISIRQMTDNGNRKYYAIRFKEPVNTSRIQFGVGRYGSTPWQVTISEVRFHEYDSIEQDIMNLYTDNLHVVLRDDVTADVIDRLQARLDTADPVSGEYHPFREALLKELMYAKQLLETQNLADVVEINPNITSKKDAQIAVGGLNAWQPLGTSAAAGEEIVVYVGYPGMESGRSTSLRLVFTQYHAESGGLFHSVALKAGRNEITVPKISSTDVESGGALYIQYEGNNENDAYVVRVSGGTKYPVLNVYGVTGEERTEKIKSYIKELSEFVPAIETEHEKAHKGSGNRNVAYDYDPANCIANSTDIVMDQMMFSIPASQALAGLGTEDLETKLADTVSAMENMLLLFYQHKGLTNAFAEGTAEDVIAKNHLPFTHLNIRYMRMFAGAFMYASGNHIGIEWNETKGMMGGVPIVSSEDGKYISGRYFGWGIAHEIGHDINQSAYAHAEVTNNYFAVLAQAKDSNDSVRFRYPEVFKKVTSGTKGYSDNVFTQLGMYWQLHLAYDRDYNYKTYNTYQEITENLFFARVDSYARDTAAAPAPGGIALTLDADRDQNIMRLASAAAGRDLSEFFERWGMTADETTKAYTGQFAPEERAIYYVDDAARAYEIEQGSSTTAIAGKDVVEAKAAANDSEVTLALGITGEKEALQGYEIVRVYMESGEEKREVAGFTQGDSFVDHVVSNRAVFYEVTAIDKCMNRSAVCRTNAVKGDGDGLCDKSFWKAASNMISDEDSTTDATVNDPCEPAVEAALNRILDNDSGTTFTGRTEGEDPYIILELNCLTEVSALRYKMTGEGTAVTDYKIEVSADGDAYTTVKEGTFNLSDGSAMVYFENGTDPWICTYDAAYVRLTATGQAGKNISVSELDLFGPSGDNIEFLTGDNGISGIGRLNSDYVYEQSTGEKIPAGSLIFTGNYKGNPAYNVVVLYDESGQIVGGVDENGALVAQQIILAPETENALLGETSEGTWIYWIEPVHNAALPTKVRAELYRVDNALTNEGQRMVSDTLFLELPAELPSISLN